MSEELCRERLPETIRSTGQGVHARHLLTMLLSQDGSTTRVCEAITGGPVSVRVLHQQAITEVSGSVRSMLPGNRFLHRVAALETRGHVLLDSLSYIAVEALPGEIVQELETGKTPIGHLLARLWTKREFHRHDAGLLQELWGRVGLPDPQASRSYTVFTPEGPCMLIAETFRGGILRPLAESDADRVHARAGQSTGGNLA